VSLDQAQFQVGMLRALHSGEQSDQHELSISFLTDLRESCVAQRRADGLWHVPWSRRLLACLHRITGADVLIGTRAVARHPTLCVSVPRRPEPGCRAGLARCRGSTYFSLTPLSRTIGLHFGAKWMPIHSPVRVDSPSSATGGRAHQGSQCLALS
jgi:hypothetical protein